VREASHFDVAANGTLVYPQAAPDRTTDKRVLVWVDRQGRETVLAVPADTFVHPRLSPDRSRLAFSAGLDIHILELTRRGRLHQANGSYFGS